MSVTLQRSISAMRNLVVSYDQELSTEMTNEVLSKPCRLLLDRLTPAGWEAAGRDVAYSLTSGSFPDLVRYDPDVLDLAASDQYALYQCLAFFRKRSDIDIGVDREAAARGKFRAAEQACQLTNDCFRAWSQGRFQFRPFVESVLHRASRKISELLEQSGLLDPSAVDFRPRFGPGATTQVAKKNACLGVKLGSVPACSTNAVDFSGKLLSGISTGVYRGESTLVSGGAANSRMTETFQVDVPIHLGKLAFVAKNAKTDRAICTEPSLNGMYQLGVGDQLARALRTVGIDIRDQSSNQRAAMYGSISGALATLDLSSASDTVSIGLISHLFPGAWTDLFMTLRTEAILDRKGKESEVIRLAKVSSMGNGFTFPLETMVFWALALSTVEILRCRNQRVRVYGDDIIVDTDAAVPLMSVLRDLGFTPNPEKSFWTGHFRESCGADFMLGTNVRPVFVDGPLTGADFFRLHNFFVGRGDYQIAKFFEDCIHPSIRLRGPRGYGDGHLHSNVWVSKIVRKRRDGVDCGWSGFHFDTWTRSVRHLKKEVRRRFMTEKGGKIQYNGSHHRLVVAIATYGIYLREETMTRNSRNWGDPPDGREQLRDYALRFSARVDDPLQPWVIPGEGPVRRTRVYTFETPVA